MRIFRRFAYIFGSSSSSSSRNEYYFGGVIGLTSRLVGSIDEFKMSYGFCNCMHKYINMATFINSLTPDKELNLSTSS